MFGSEISPVGYPPSCSTCSVGAVSMIRVGGASPWRLLAALQTGVCCKGHVGGRGQTGAGMEGNDATRTVREREDPGVKEAVGCGAAVSLCSLWALGPWAGVLGWSHMQGKLLLRALWALAINKSWLGLVPCSWGVCPAEGQLCTGVSCRP